MNVYGRTMMDAYATPESAARPATRVCEPKSVHSIID